MGTEHVDVPVHDLRVGDVTIGYTTQGVHQRYSPWFDCHVYTVSRLSDEGSHHLLENGGEALLFSAGSRASARVRLPRPALPGAKVDLMANLDWFATQTCLALRPQDVDDIQKQGQAVASGSATIIDLLTFQKLCATAREATNRKNEAEANRDGLLLRQKKVDELAPALEQALKDCSIATSNWNRARSELDTVRAELATARADLNTVSTTARNYINGLERRFKTLKTRRANAAKKSKKARKS